MLHCQAEKKSETQEIEIVPAPLHNFINGGGILISFMICIKFDPVVKSLVHCRR